MKWLKIKLLSKIMGGEKKLPKFICSYCNKGCEVAYSGIEAIEQMGGKVFPHNLHACRKCYRQQYFDKEGIYPRV